MKKTAVVYDKWLHQFGGAEMVACTIAKILKEQGWDVTFVSGKYVHLHKIKDKFGIDLSDIPFYEVWNHENRLRKLVEGKDLFVNLSFMDYSYGYAKRNIYYTHFPTPIRGPLFNMPLEIAHITGLHVLLPKQLRERVYNRIRAGIYFDMDKRLASYDLILANSKFTRKWIRRYWNLESAVLYPPVSNDVGKIHAHKKKWICSLGRFFTLGHGKRQEVLIDAFRKLYDQGLTDWELHLMGGVGDEPSTHRFMDILKAKAKGYPVIFHLNVPKVEVMEVLSTSRIYWHATGYGESETSNPMAFEHFGIAPVEAIESGCVPVLFNKGGLREILEQYGLPLTDHAFDDIDGLVSKTALLIKNKLDNKRPNTPLAFSSFNEKFLGLI